MCWGDGLGGEGSKSSPSGRHQAQAKNTIETEVVLHLEQLGLGGPAFEPCAEFSRELGAVLRLGGLKPRFGHINAEGAPISTEAA